MFRDGFVDFARISQESTSLMHHVQFMFVSYSFTAIAFNHMWHQHLCSPSSMFQRQSSSPNVWLSWRNNYSEQHRMLWRSYLSNSL